MPNNAIVAIGKCVRCGCEVDVKVSKSNKPYYFCGCGARIWLGGAESRRCLSALSRGEMFAEMKPINYNEKQEKVEENEREKRIERDTTGQRVGVTEARAELEDDDEYF